MEIKRNTQSINKLKKIVPLFYIVIITFLGSLLGLMIATKADDTKIMPHIHINDVHIGNLTQDEAKNALSKTYNNENDNFITIHFDNNKKVLSLSDIGISYDLDHTIDLAFNEDKKNKSFFSTISNFTYRFRKKVMPVSIRLDEEIFNNYISNLLDEINKEATEAKIEIINEELIIENGKSGIGFYKDDIKKEIIKSVINDNKTIKINSKEIKPKEIDVDTLYEEYTGDPVDAHYIVKNNEAILVSEKYGITFDKEKARKIIEENREEGKRFVIPVNVIKPKRFKDEIKDYLFRDVLGEYSTGYATSSVNRASNVELANSKLNGVILGPGDEFSFNKVVGERSARTGYKTAHVYVAGMIEEGIGGGICQVSSTLYNAVLNSNLQITERRNHQLIVGYVPLGQDATVAYGAIDFKFKNDTEFPIKIVATNKNRVMNIRILGTRFDKISVSIENKILSTTPPTVIERLDPTLPQGVRKVTQRGANGYIVESYQLIKKDGVVIERKYLGKSNYKPTNEYVLVGTNPVVAVEPEPEDENVLSINTEEDLNKDDNNEAETENIDNVGDEVSNDTIIDENIDNLQG